MSMFQSGTIRWIFILLMFIPLFIMCVIGIGFFAMKQQYFAAFFLLWLISYLFFWFAIGCSIHVSITDKFSTRNDYFIVIPSQGGNLKVVLSGGHEYKKVGEGRPQEYVVCDSKPKDVHINTGIVFRAETTDYKFQLREIDVIDQIDNRLYIRGYFELNEQTKTYTNHLDLSSLPAQMGLLSLELKTMVKTKEGLENMYERSIKKVFEERVGSLEGQGVLMNLLTRTLEDSNTVTGKFSGTTTNLENRKVDAKLGSDAKVKSMIDEQFKKIKENMLAQIQASKGE